MTSPLKHRPFRLAIAAAVAALLTVAAATPTAAQQAAQQATEQAAQQAIGSAVPVEAGAVQASTPSTPLPGPRLTPQWMPLEPTIADLGGTAAPLGPAPPANTTIVISTLALVLIAIILTILIVD